MNSEASQINAGGDRAVHQATKMVGIVDPLVTPTRNNNVAGGTPAIGDPAKAASIPRIAADTGQ